MLGRRERSMSSQEFLRKSTPGSATVDYSTVPRNGLFGNDDGNMSSGLRHVHIVHCSERVSLSDMVGNGSTAHQSRVNTDAYYGGLDDAGNVGEAYGNVVP